MDGVLLAKAFERNMLIIKAQTEGVSHEDSLTQAPYNINCLNWVIGHLAQSRDVVLDVLGGEPVLPPEVFDRYERESDPVTGDGPDVARLEDLVGAIERQQEAIAIALEDLTHADLEVPHRWGDREMPLMRRLHFQYFHDTYHTGQTDLLRQVSGKEDKVI